jgi:hypothetical protein
MLKSGALAACAVASFVACGTLAASSTPAEAGWRRGHAYAPGYRYAGPRAYHRGYRGRNVGLGIAAGVLAAGALAAAASPAYAAPAYGYEPAYGYPQPVYYAPRCVVRQRTVWDPYYGYVSQPVRVCR